MCNTQSRGQMHVHLILPSTIDGHAFHIKVVVIQLMLEMSLFGLGKVAIPMHINKIFDLVKHMLV